MKCEACSELLSQYIDNELAENDRNEVEKHLEQCSACMEEYKLICSTITSVCKLKCNDLPENFHNNVMQKIHNENKSKKILWPMWGSLTLGSLAAAALLMVAIINNPFNLKHDPQRINIAENKPPINIFKNESINQKQQWEDFYNKQTANNVSKKHIAPGVVSKTSTNLIRAVAYGKQINTTPAISRAEDNSELYRQNCEWSGEDSKITEKKAFIINNSQDISKIWKETGITPLPLTKMNWKKNNLIALFIGEQVGRGFEIQLKNIQRENNKLVVTYSIIKPSVINNSQISNPFLIFEIKKTNLPIEFIEK